jgi:hypothetical protein
MAVTTQVEWKLSDFGRMQCVHNDLHVSNGQGIHRLLETPVQRTQMYNCHFREFLPQKSEGNWDYGSTNEI